MHTLSMEQALNIWSELEQAYHGTNSYDGHTAELYVFQFMAHSPTIGVNPTSRFAGEAYDKANLAMYHLLQYFATTRKAFIVVEGSDLGEWLASAKYTHRVRVEVKPNR